MNPSFRTAVRAPGLLSRIRYSVRGLLLQLQTALARLPAKGATNAGAKPPRAQPGDSASVCIFCARSQRGSHGVRGGGGRGGVCVRGPPPQHWGTVQPSQHPYSTMREPQPRQGCPLGGQGGSNAERGSGGARGPGTLRFQDQRRGPGSTGRPLPAQHPSQHPSSLGSASSPPTSASPPGQGAACCPRSPARRGQFIL